MKNMKVNTAHVSSVSSQFVSPGKERVKGSWRNDSDTWTPPLVIAGIQKGVIAFHTNNGQFISLLCPKII